MTFSEASGTLASILVVDDDQAIRAVVGVLLRDEGYEVVEARDGKEALDEIRMRRPDLVVLDLRMPRLDGARVLESLKGLDRPPVILLSASPDAPAVARNHDVRMVRKPFDLDVLLRAISGLLAA